MKKIISIVLAMVLCAAICTVSVNAALPPYNCGDVNWDGDFDIVDVTLTQRHLAGIIEFNDVTEKPMADFDHDGEVTILDVTWMQRSLAGIQIPEYCGGTAEYWFEIKSFSTDYDSGKAAVGVPVTLTAEAHNPYDLYGDMPLLYEFYVNGELVQERSFNNTANVTFDSPGFYYLQVKVYNWQGFSEEYNIYSYQVVQSYPYDQLNFKSVRFKEREGMSYYPTLITEAMGGTAPYVYSLKFYHYNYYSDGAVVSLTDEEIANISAYLADNSYPDWMWQLKTDEYGRTYLYREFIEEEETQWCMEMFPWGGRYWIVVQAVDAYGNYSPIKEIMYMNDMMIG